MGFFSRSKPKFKQLSTQTPGQQSFLDMMLQNLGEGGLAGEGYKSSIENLLKILSGDPEAFEDFQRPTMRQFEESTIPSILERFSGQGARSSSGLQQTLGRAGERLGETLGQQRAGLQQNAIQQLLSNFLSQSGLGLGTRSFETVGSKGKPSGLQSLLGGLNPLSSQLGSGLGFNLGQGLFGGSI